MILRRETRLWRALDQEPRLALVLANRGVGIEDEDLGLSLDEFCRTRAVAWEEIKAALGQAEEPELSDPVDEDWEDGRGDDELLGPRLNIEDDEEDVWARREDQDDPPSEPEEDW